MRVSFFRSFPFAAAFRSGWLAHDAAIALRAPRPVEAALLAIFALALVALDYHWAPPRRLYAELGREIAALARAGGRSRLDD